MPKSALTLSFHRAFAALAAAARAASAVDSRRTARSEDLKTLGIDPAVYSRVQL
jgi:MoxR-like ATPase